MKNDNTDFIKIENLSKSFENKGNTIQVIDNLNFSIEQGEVLCIMGPSGVGKSTLLNLLGTIDEPDDGYILFNGENPFDLDDNEIARFRNERIGFVFQFHHLLPEFTALENVYLPSLVYSDSKKENVEKAKNILSEVGMEHRFDHKPSELSGGERQRVAVARALINNPQIILGDEPSGNLDLDNSKRLLDLLFDLNEQYDTSFVIATHNPSIAERCDRTIDLGEVKNK